MHEPSNNLIRTAWPTPQDYNEAVQNLSLNLRDGDLHGGTVETDLLGLPRPRTGSFATVYRVHCPGKDFALRCFLNDIPDTRERYERISQFVREDKLPYTVDFHFQPQGIRIRDAWFPILTMEWVDGDTLDNYINARGGRVSEELAQRFATMCAELRTAGIAHGDLQHGNIMIRDDSLFLVDYDDMFVPGMEGWNCNAIGHRNYQHPRRSAETFGASLDNFSAWVIYISLYGLAVDPELLKQLGAGENALLFRQQDFQRPLQSCAFAALERHAHDELKNLSRALRWFIMLPPEAVPPLSPHNLIVPQELPDIENWVMSERADPNQLQIVVASDSISAEEYQVLDKLYSKSLRPDAVLHSGLSVSGHRTIVSHTPWACVPAETKNFFLCASLALIPTYAYLSTKSPPFITPILVSAAVVCAVIAAALAFILTMGVRWHTKSRYLVEVGIPAVGTITGKEPAKNDGSTVYRIFFRYRYDHMDHSGSFTTDSFENSLISAGDTCTVLVDPTGQVEPMVYDRMSYSAYPDVPKRRQPVSSKSVISHIEPELVQPLPRNVSRDGQEFEHALLAKLIRLIAISLGFGAMFAAVNPIASGLAITTIIVAMIILFTRATHSRAEVERDLLTTGMATRATITSVSEWVGTTVEYRFFNDITGINERGRMKLSTDQWLKLKLGQELTVLFDTSMTPVDKKGFRKSVIYKFAKGRAV